MLINGVPAMAKAAGKALRAVIKNEEKPEHIADNHSTTDLNTIIKTEKSKPTLTQRMWTATNKEVREKTSKSLQDGKHIKTHTQGIANAANGHTREEIG